MPSSFICQLLHFWLLLFEKICTRMAMVGSKASKLVVEPLLCHILIMIAHQLLATFLSALPRHDNRCDHGQERQRVGTQIGWPLFPQVVSDAHLKRPGQAPNKCAPHGTLPWTQLGNIHLAQLARHDVQGQDGTAQERVCGYGPREETQRPGHGFHEPQQMIMIFHFMNLS